MKIPSKNLSSLLILFLLIGAFAFLPKQPSSDFLASVLNEENIVSLTNAARKNSRLTALAISPKLEKAADEKAKDILDEQYFAHTSPAGKTPWSFFDSAEYKYLYAGENLGMHFTTSEAITEGWLASEGHRENILSDTYTEIGVGVAQGRFMGNSTTVVVQMFGKPLAVSPSKKRVSQRSTKKSAAGPAWPGTPSNSPTHSALQKKSLPQYISDLEAQKIATWKPKASALEVFSPGAEEDSLPFSESAYGYFVLSGTAFLFYFLVKMRRKQQ
ncbi:MAG: CAP domain-containing protein [Patescibacteria group bacterium]